MSYTQSHAINIRRHRIDWLVVVLLGPALGVVLAACGANESDTAPGELVPVNSEDADRSMDAGSETMDMSGMDAGAMTSMAPMTSIGSQEWQGMDVEVAVTAPTTFTLFQGVDRQEVPAKPDDNFHLMAVLSDGESGERIPYADLWVTFTSSSGGVVFDERLWPMLSRAMGTHYGINVELPEPGTYAITLQVGAPQGARHPEYADRWLQATSMEFEYSWNG